MKKFFAAVLIGLFVAAPAFAVNRDNVGCGLGSMLLEEKDGLLWEIMATSTNGTSGNQTFGITSGTLGCEKPANFAKREQLDRFVADNMDSLAVDIAMGEGETLGALAELAEVDESRRVDFFVALQMNFDTIYPNGKVAGTQVVDQITDILAQI
ncbi:Protein of unknown function (DUF3015) [Desulfobotulus alkaliphilus]|uniref:DUF3015 family protein n=1 Tax=Desulfobotulus alkaliphilus TaxID=622671 RepID=A0A562RPA0_9BACT|nr:DUF3015 family protein [Desulfobotulus alkaliphilus]TWI70733.1 Protein of unknown function (DUF3015) [Desulfobotulus alkaliphilus]